MDNISRKRKLKDSEGGSSVQEIKPEPPVIDLADSENGINNALAQTPLAPRANHQELDARSIDLDSFTVLADRNQEMIESLMSIPEELREEMAVKTTAVKNDVTTSMVAFTKEMSESLNGTKQELKERIDNYNPRLGKLEKRANALDGVVKDLEKKYDKKIKTVQNEASKNHGAEIKAEIKGEVDERLRGFGAYIAEYFTKGGLAVPTATANATATANMNGGSNGDRNRVVQGLPAPGGVRAAPGGVADGLSPGLGPSPFPFPIPALGHDPDPDVTSAATKISAATKVVAPATPVPAPAPAPAPALGGAGRVSGGGGGGTHTNASSDLTADAPLILARSTTERFPLLSKKQFLPHQVLTNKGYRTLMTKVQWTDMNHLVQLLKLDNSSIARRCIIFTDLTFPNQTIDYVLHAGHSVRRMGDPSYHPHPGGEHQPPEVNDLLREADLDQLRVMRMKLNPNVMLQEDREQFAKWERRWQPPAYVYDLGELVLRKRGTRQPYATTSVLTPYNLLLEINKAGSPNNRRVWIAMAKQHEVTRRQSGSRDSNNAFNGLEYSRLALLARRVSEIEFDATEFSGYSHGFEEAHRLVLDSLCPGFPSVDFDNNISLKKMCSDLA